MTKNTKSKPKRKRLRTTQRLAVVERELGRRLDRIEQQLAVVERLLVSALPAASRALPAADVQRLLAENSQLRFEILNDVFVPAGTCNEWRRGQMLPISDAQSIVGHMRHGLLIGIPEHEGLLREAAREARDAFERVVTAH